ncbi:MAG: hypothetical protein H7839_05395 [Magnetococcus sp. YQC-5]
MLTIELPSGTEEMFQSVSKETGRSLNELVQDALDRFLEAWEDQQDAADADRFYREFQESGEAGTPWETVKAELDAKHAL